jgi:hypothetical protein
MEMSGQLHALADLFPGKDPGILREGGLVVFRASLEILFKRKIS